MKHLASPHCTSTALACAGLTCLALWNTSALAQTPPQGWPWGTGFERRQAPPASAPSDVPPNTAPANPNRAAAPAAGASHSAQAGGRGESGGGNSGGNSGGGSGGGGRGR